MSSLAQPITNEQFRQNVADLYGDHMPSAPAVGPSGQRQRWQQAALRAAEQLSQGQSLDQARLAKALDLVLANAVTLHPDGTATVKSGSHSYHINGECSCEDARHRTKHCKHALAVLIHRRATALLEGTAPAPAAPSVTPPAVVPAAAGLATPSAPASAAWDVHEAPASACFRFRVGNFELMYTLRGIGDAELQARIKDTLPLLQDILEGCEERAARRAAAREAAQAAQAVQAQQTPPAPPPASAPTDLQALLQQAVQRALAAQSTGAASANGQAPPATANGTAPFCQAHQAPLELRSNDRGSWWSHWVAGEKRYCKGE
jgi:hypothetical protein